MEGSKNLKKELNIFQKIQRARVELQRKELKQTGLNKYSNYKYFELGDFLPYVNDICDKVGLYCEFQFEANLATLSIYDCDNPDSFRRWTTPIEIATLKGCSSLQNIGGTQSYARRYLYLMAFEISEGDSVDGGEIDQEAEEGKAKINKPTIMIIRKLIDETETDINKFLSWAQVEKIEDIQNYMKHTCINMLREKKEKMDEKKKEEELNF